MHDQSQKAKEFKALLVRLSGRQTKRKQPITAPALLAGYLILLSASHATNFPVQCYVILP